MRISQRTVKHKVQPRKSRFSAPCALIGAMILIMPTAVTEAWGQTPLIPGLEQVEQVLTSRSDKFTSDTVRLDGHKLFQIAVPTVSDAKISRTRIIEKRLDQFAKSNADPAKLAIASDTEDTDQGNELAVIKINDQYLMTVTTLDAELQGSTPPVLAEEWTQIIKEALVRAKQERQLEFLIQRSGWTAGIALSMILGSAAISRQQRRSSSWREVFLAQTPTGPTPFTTGSSDTGPVSMAAVHDQAVWRQQRNLNVIQRRLLLAGQAVVWGGGTFLILGLFPQTRWLQPLVLSGLQGPLKVLGVVLGTSLAIRTSAVLIDRFFATLKEEQILAPEESQRLALRVSTFSLVLKRTIAVAWAGVGVLVALAAVGVNIGPLLAGAGIIGLAISFASQSLIKDVINGFFILLDDQYAVGDVIVVGDVGGFVENINLRITQLRNDEGRLITIPNSAISIVQNLSKDWSRVDLKLYIDYDTDLHQALDVIEQVGLEMSHEKVWRKKILEPPEVLGVDELQHSGVMIRVWIKTQPLEQWTVAREYRRRLKLALDGKGISMGVPQQTLLFKDSLKLHNAHFGDEIEPVPWRSDPPTN